MRYCRIVVAAMVVAKVTDGDGDDDNGGGGGGDNESGEGGGGGGFEIGLNIFK